MNAQVTYRPSSGELNLLLDSTGIKFLGEGEWKCKKHGAATHGIDVQTSQVRAICITSNHISDATVVPNLLAQLPEREPLLSVKGDGTYDTEHYTPQ